jgi:ribosome maturation factor RimP
MRVGAVRAVIEPIVASLDLELFDLTVDGRTLQLTLDREGGIDLDALTAATQAVSAALDAADQRAPGLDSGSYSLEVSSPGLERPLRTPAHFRGVVGATVSVKVSSVKISSDSPEGAGSDESAGAGEAIRYRGVLVDAGDDACTVDVDGSPVRVGYDAIVAARTVFEWGPAPKPGSGGRRKKSAKKKVATR